MAIRGPAPGRRSAAGSSGCARRGSRRRSWPHRRRRRRRAERCTSARSPSVRARLGGVPDLKDQLRADLTTAMKSRDELRTATLRMALAAVSAEEVAGKQARELSDDEVQAVLRREAKKRREAADAFADAGRAEQAERE